MRSRAALAEQVLGHAHRTLMTNVGTLTLEEALSTAGGYRSILGVLKHTAGWCHVYHSYAFEPAPIHWAQTDWPRGLRDTVETTQDYLDEILAWLATGHEKWTTSVAELPDDAFDEPRPVHWGDVMPLFDIVSLVAHHTGYHTGELNMILSILREEAWEYTEEVEENHVPTSGHRVRPGWMSDEQAKSYEAYLAGRDRELRG